VLAAQFAERNAVADTEQKLTVFRPQGVAQIEDFFLSLDRTGQLHCHFHARLSVILMQVMACAGYAA
jgi:hypothetical protein